MIVVVCVVFVLLKQGFVCVVFVTDINMLHNNNFHDLYTKYRASALREIDHAPSAIFPVKYYSSRVFSFSRSQRFEMGSPK